ncbi:fumarylacetoacetate hydrolase family protein [Selenihalanaerobacter shriftii]|uniref:2-keto-4-pentenoate hydratase/2-oxohepta-3-ene-1,7-dioic acid hydratase (Catechol pathway) n=1 Tax=Selenihalanaerobacter shriftii TaxID=142842 RepID=A0A1T4JWP3_9FIRM|nr:fumarylacetoacetate hydrolase family protein [Selenihalanaerobacter shriftii]SJZ34543.1 2-keto-4-pentenoate hydratase/2-oxohepta-3-ene-1,7-dioic acid hydratase (catechol pathway) [Selenihalanaerobacter shriftii]
MKFVRFRKDAKIQLGILNENDKIRAIQGDIKTDYELTEEYYDLANVELLTPCQPSKIICVGLNYLDHAKELNMELPEEPVIFMKPSTSVIGPEDEINYPQMSSQVDYEAEIAVVMKKEAKDLTIEEVEDYILGYTCFNDVTARDLQTKDGQWTRAKSFDTFSPLGPVIVNDINPNELKIQLYQNDSLKQDSNTSQMIFSIKEIISFISQIMTLNPGDVIATGTPPGVGEVKLSDKIEVKIEGIGSLVNTITK